MSEFEETEAGVEALIERLQARGVEAGREEADRLLAAARAEAEAMLAAAHSESAEIRAVAERETEALQKASEAALELALRDTVLRLREALLLLLSERLGARVQAALDDPALVGELLRAGAKMLAGEGSLSGEVGGAVLGEAQLAALADLLVRDLAEREPQLRLNPALGGVVLRRAGQNIAVELTDELLTAFLFAQLQPRFRKIFDGARL